MSDKVTLPTDTVVKVGRTAYTLTKEAAALMNATAAKTAKTYLLKASCPECDYTIRITRKWAFKALPACPCCSDHVTGYVVPLMLDTSGAAADETQEG